MWPWLPIIHWTSLYSPLYRSSPTLHTRPQPSLPDPSPLATDIWWSRFDACLFTWASLCRPLPSPNSAGISWLVMYSGRAGGMSPTGMLSCCYVFFSHTFCIPSKWDSFFEIVNMGDWHGRGICEDIIFIDNITHEWIMSQFLFWRFIISWSFNYPSQKTSLLPFDF